ncbi:MAG: hypothetical protein AAFN10_16670 [Bacteroidota bacterium]
MEALDLYNNRHFIAHNFARWCAFSSMRSGSPVKSRKAVYPLIDGPEYAEILSGTDSITKAEFNTWHEKSILKILDLNPALPVGWAAKLINVYLKTMVYIASIGRPGLKAQIHPPIDGGLWDGIKAEFRDNLPIYTKTHSVRKIKDIVSYEHYSTIIEGLEMIAAEKNWTLIEIEKLWQGTEYKN